MAARKTSSYIKKRFSQFIAGNQMKNYNCGKIWMFRVLLVIIGVEDCHFQRQYWRKYSGWTPLSVWKVCSHPVWKKLPSALRETSVSHDGGLIKGPLIRPHNTIVLCWSEGFQGDPHWGRETPQSLGQLYVWSWLFFQFGFWYKFVSLLLLWCSVQVLMATRLTLLHWNELYSRAYSFPKSN